MVDLHSSPEREPSELVTKLRERARELYEEAVERNSSTEVRAREFFLDYFERVVKEYQSAGVDGMLADMMLYSMISSDDAVFDPFTDQVKIDHKEIALTGFETKRGVSLKPEIKNFIKGLLKDLPLPFEHYELVSAAVHQGYTNHQLSLQDTIPGVKIPGSDLSKDPGWNVYHWRDLIGPSSFISLE